MSNTAKGWLIAALILVGIGAIVFAAAMAMNGWNFSSFNTGKYQTNTYEIPEDFSSISIRTETEDIRFVLSEDGKCRVECFETEHETHEVHAENGTLTITLKDERKWYEHIGIFLDSPKTTVYLPKTVYASLQIRESTGDIRIPKDFSFENADVSANTGSVTFLSSVTGTLRIGLTTGDVRVEGISAGSVGITTTTGEVVLSDVTCVDVRLESTTGDLHLSAVQCADFFSKGSTGSAYLKELKVSGGLAVERSTGDVRFFGSDAAEISVKTTTGDISGTLLTPKIFLSQTSTGRVNVPRTAEGGRCELTTSTGDIDVSIS